MLKLFLFFVVSTTLFEVVFSAPLETADLLELRDELEDKLEISTSTIATTSTDKADNKDKDPKPVAELTTVSPSLPASTPLPTTLAEKPAQTLAPLPARRIVTFDQRQEGRFNVRADLENLLVIFVTDTSESSSGSASPQQTLLDLLKRSAANSKANVNKNQSKKYKKDQKVVPVSEVSDYSFKVPPFKVPYYPQFAQSRSPYHVDIDSNLESRALFYQPTGSLSDYQQELDHPPMIQFLKAIPSAGQ